MKIRELIRRLEELNDPDREICFSPAGDDNCQNTNDIAEVLGPIDPDPECPAMIYGCEEKS
jgi:hypothetical protein